MNIPILFTFSVGKFLSFVFFKSERNNDDRILVRKNIFNSGGKGAAYETNVSSFLEGTILTKGLVGGFHLRKILV
jgi:hypothetical protein